MSMSSNRMTGLGSQNTGQNQSTTLDDRGSLLNQSFAWLNWDTRQMRLDDQVTQRPSSRVVALAVFWIIVYWAFRAWEIRFYSLDYDELFSVTAAKMGMRGLLAFIAN